MADEQLQRELKLYLEEAAATIDTPADETALEAPNMDAGQDAKLFPLSSDRKVEDDLTSVDKQPAHFNEAGDMLPGEAEPQPTSQETEDWLRNEVEQQATSLEPENSLQDEAQPPTTSQELEDWLLNEVEHEASSQDAEDWLLNQVEQTDHNGEVDDWLLNEVDTTDGPASHSDPNLDVPPPEDGLVYHIDAMPSVDSGSKEGADEDGDETIVLSRQGGSVVTLVNREVVFKTGSRVRYNEEAAMRLAQESTTIPVAEIFMSGFNPDHGTLAAMYIPGRNLKHVWDTFDDQSKEAICRQTWGFIDQLRKVPKPERLSHLFACGVDGTPSNDVFLEDLEHNPPRPIHDEEELRGRMSENYCRYGTRYTKDQMLDMLPRAEKSVFTHGDIAPRNLIVATDSHKIIGVIDWELSGFYPDWWEYCKMMKPSDDEDWQKWMDLTAPERPDMHGVNCARSVLIGG